MIHDTSRKARVFRGPRTRERLNRNSDSVSVDANKDRAMNCAATTCEPGPPEGESDAGKLREKTGLQSARATDSSSAGLGAASRAAAALIAGIAAGRQCGGSCDPAGVQASSVHLRLLVTAGSLHVKSIPCLWNEVVGQVTQDGTDFVGETYGDRDLFSESC